MKKEQDLKTLLEAIDRKSYPAYKDTAGSYRFRNFILSIDHVQGDPFASPSDISVHISADTAGFPEEVAVPRKSWNGAPVLFHRKAMWFFASMWDFPPTGERLTHGN